MLPEACVQYVMWTKHAILFLFRLTVFLFRCPDKHVPDEDELLLLLREPFITRGEILQISVHTI